jgi:hypothetical protein
MTNPAAPQIPGLLCTLASYEGLFGPYHPQTLAVATMLAVALCNSSRRDEGRKLLERTLADLTKHYGRHHPIRVQALEAWAALLCQEANWQAALAAQHELLECRTDALGADHPESLAAREHLTRTLGAMTSAFPA